MCKMVACVALHNFYLTMGDEVSDVPEEYLDEEDDNSIVQNASATAAEIRNKLVEFWQAKRPSRLPRRQYGIAPNQ